MKHIKKCPIFILLVGTGILFTIIGIIGKNNIYAEQEYNPMTSPILSVMFTGIHDDIYPWQIFTGESSQTMALGKAVEEELQTDVLSMEEENPEENEISNKESVSDNSLVKASPDASAKESQAPEEEQVLEEEEVIEEGRLKPLRESTPEEYKNHISADIYGDAGVLRAAGYEFLDVDESYFDDALFIGDSRTVGLRDYTDLSKHADFYCETSLTIYKVLDENFDGKGTVVEALENNDYGKIYIMVGINELGRGKTEDFMEEYTKVIDTLHELEPEAKIFIQGVMRVSGDKNNSDPIFNNSNINARNNAIATLADNKQFFYIDVNEVICDEEGNLVSEYTFDQIHLLGAYYDLWKQFLLAHGAGEEPNQPQIGH